MAQAKPTKAQIRAQDDAYNEFKAKAYAEPIDWFKHDSNARYDEKVRLMVVERGLRYYGLWWVLVELLYQNKGHIYDVSTETGWKLLAVDVSTCGEVLTVDETKEAIQVFLHYGMIEQSSFNEFHQVANARVLEAADGVAATKAANQLKAWKTNNAKHNDTDSEATSES